MGIAFQRAVTLRFLCLGLHLAFESSIGQELRRSTVLSELSGVVAGFNNISVCGRAVELELRAREKFFVNDVDAFIGSVVGDPSSTVHVSLYEGGATGSVPLGGVTCVVIGQGGGSSVESLVREPRSEVDSSIPAPVAMEAQNTASSRQNGSPVVDVCVFYTQRALTYAGSAIGMAELVGAMQNEVNLVYSNGEIDTRVVMHVGGETSFSDGSSSFTWLTTIYAFQNKSDGMMDEIHQSRDEEGCDLNLLLVNPVDYGGSAGIAFINGPAAYAFGVVGVANAIGTMTTAHEIGHSMGCDHDPASIAERDNPVSYGAYYFSKGYFNINNEVGSVMALRREGSTRLPVHSQVDEYQGYIVGDEEHDCRRTIRLRSFTVANFRDRSSVSTDAPVTTSMPDPTSVPEETTAPTSLDPGCVDLGGSAPISTQAKFVIRNRNTHKVGVFKVKPDGTEKWLQRIKAKENMTYKGKVGDRLRVKYQSKCRTNGNIEVVKKWQRQKIF